MQARRGELVDVLEGVGLVAVQGDAPLGLVTWALDRVEAEAGDAGGAWTGDVGAGANAAEAQAAGAPSLAEIRVLAVDPSQRGSGVGRALLAATEKRLRDAGVRRAWLVTTNDNLAALALYQKAGWRLAVLRPGALDETRRTLKPQIPAFGQHGIPLRDELELRKEL